jgi:hypothetical protein
VQILHDKDGVGVLVVTSVVWVLILMIVIVTEIVDLILFDPRERVQFSMKNIQYVHGKTRRDPFYFSE